MSMHLVDFRFGYTIVNSPTSFPGTSDPPMQTQPSTSQCGSDILDDTISEDCFLFTPSVFFTRFFISGRLYGVRITLNGRKWNHHV